MRSSGSQLATPESSGTARRRVLIVDDNADAANSLGRLLNLLGNEVCVAHDGPSAIAQVGCFQPAAVLLDLGMPIMDGFQTAEQIRARADWRDIVLVAITGWGQDHDRQRTEEAGFAAHLIKPVNVDELEAVLDRVVGRQNGNSDAGPRVAALNQSRIGSRSLEGGP